MWKVRLPDTGDIDAQLDAALIRQDETKVHDLSDAERAAVHALYGDYDHRLGEADPGLKPAALDDCADALHDAYGQIQVGGRLESLRGTLLSAVLECPLCGFADAKTLDHHLPKSDYRALSINPRNLVPCCQPCNRAKGTHVPVAGKGFIHAYFESLPHVTFLKAAVNYDGGKLTTEFEIDETVIPQVLAERLTFQLERLQLSERTRGAVNIFLFGQKTSIRQFRGKADERLRLRKFLLDSAETLDEDFGLNHWRTALLRGLAGCNSFLDDPWSYFDKPPEAMKAPA